jgi:hypothetical protein
MVELCSTNIGSNTTQPQMQGCQMVCFEYSKTKYGYILGGLGMENASIFSSIWNIFQPFCTFCGHLVYFVVIWYIFPHLGMLNQKESGNSGQMYSQQQNLAPFVWTFG